MPIYPIIMQGIDEISPLIVLMTYINKIAKYLDNCKSVKK